MISARELHQEVNVMDEYGASVERETSRDELKQIKEILEETGFDWKVDASFMRKSYLEKIPWLILLYLPLRKFIDSFMSEAGKDVYHLLKDILKKLYNLRRTRTGAEGSILIRDIKSKIIYKLPMEINDKDLSLALQKLRETDLNGFDHGWIYYDEERSLWLPFGEKFDI